MSERKYHLARCNNCGTKRKSPFVMFVKVRASVLRCAKCGGLTNHTILSEKEGDNAGPADF